MSNRFKYDIENLIRAVKERPCLWDKSLEVYKDRLERRSAWEEIFTSLESDYHELSMETQRAIGEEVLKKWNNLRDCFRREINIQNKLQRSKVKKRKYIHFDQLLFLLPFVEKNIAIESNQDAKDLEDDVEEDVDDDDPLEESGASTSTPLPRKSKKERSRSLAKYRDEALVESFNDTRDEDTNFALSLVPSLQDLTADEKLDAKISILNVFKQIRLARYVDSAAASQRTPRYRKPKQRVTSHPTHASHRNKLRQTSKSMFSNKRSSDRLTSITSSPTHSVQDIKNVTLLPVDLDDTAQSYDSDFSDQSTIEMERKKKKK